VLPKKVHRVKPVDVMVPAVVIRVHEAPAAPIAHVGHLATDDRQSFPVRRQVAVNVPLDLAK